MSRFGSATFAHAVREWRVIRAEYELHLEAQINAAERETRGNLLNPRGIALGISSSSLFLGPLSRAEAFASEELLAFWSRHPRVTFDQFERAWQPR